MTLDEIIELIPKGYEEACWDTKAMSRKKGIQNEKTLLKFCMYYAYGHSLIDVKNYAEAFHNITISDVGFSKRFINCNEWIKWILQQMAEEKVVLKYEKPTKLDEYRVLAIDASDVANKGAVKQIWRLHYAVNPFTMNSEMFKITPQKNGESLTNFSLKPKDLVLADRIYATITGIEYCLNSGADFIIRLRNKAFKIYDNEGNEIILSDLFKTMNGSYGEFTVYYQDKEKELKPIRLCVKEKSEEAKEFEKKKTKRTESKKQKKISEDTKFTHNYFFVITSLDKSFTCEQILELYRIRWQVEMVFKRYKSILGLGSIPTKTAPSTEAWLNCKMMIAMLIEKMLSLVDFSPYNATPKKPLEGDEDIIQFDFGTLF